ncbi:unnamed protein product, partial [Symbiodinium microadriaticum]
KKALALNPDDGHAKENMEVLQSFAQGNGIDRKKLEALGRKAELDLMPGSRAPQESAGSTEEEAPKSRELRSLTSAASIGARAKELPETPVVLEQICPVDQGILGQSVFVEHGRQAYVALPDFGQCCFAASGL